MMVPDLYQQEKKKKNLRCYIATWDGVESATAIMYQVYLNLISKILSLIILMLIIPGTGITLDI